MVGLSQGRSREGGPKAGREEQREAQGACPGVRLVGSEKNTPVFVFQANLLPSLKNVS